jgi:valyl-tRNA synthetase
LERLNALVEGVTSDLNTFNFSFPAERLREFTWSELADWYLEIAKIEGNKSGMLNYILNTILKLWHPYLPFVTEAIWREVYGADKLLLVEAWPKAEKSKKTKEMSQFEVLKNTISGIRSIRTDYRVTPQTKVHVVVNAGKDKEFFTIGGKIIEVLGRVEPLEIKERAEKPHHAAGFVLGSIEVFIDLEGVVDFEKERARLEKEVATVAPYAKSLEKKLSVGDFAKHAPPDVVEKEKQKLAEAQEKLTKLNEQLKQLS